MWAVRNSMTDVGPEKSDDGGRLQSRLQIKHPKSRLTRRRKSRQLCCYSSAVRYHTDTLFSSLKRLYTLTPTTYISTPFFPYRNPHTQSLSLSLSCFLSSAHVKPRESAHDNGSSPATLRSFDLHCRRRRRWTISVVSSDYVSSPANSIAAGLFSAPCFIPTPCFLATTGCNSSSHPHPTRFSSAGGHSSPSQLSAACHPSAGCSSTSSVSSASSSIPSTPHSFSSAASCSYSRPTCRSSSFSPSCISVEVSGAISVVAEPSFPSNWSSGSEPPGSFSCSVSHRSEWRKSSMHFEDVTR